MSRLYFASGPALQSPSSLRWREAHRPPLELGPGEVAEAPERYFTFDVASPSWRGRIARLAPHESRSTFGRLFSVPDARWAELESLEKSWLGANAVLQPVQVKATGRTAEGTAWVAQAQAPAAEESVSLAFLQALVAGAEAAELPDAYVTELKAEAMLLERVQGLRK